MHLVADLKKLTLAILRFVLVTVIWGAVFLTPAVLADNTTLNLSDTTANGRKLDNCGYSVATGDFNGDGKDDLVIGCYFYHDGESILYDKWDPSNKELIGLSVVFIRNKQNTGFDKAGVLVNPRRDRNNACGYSLATGDFNGDGRDDIAMGCSSDFKEPGHRIGSVVIFTRRSSNDGFSAGEVLTHPDPESEDVCGASVTTGDFNRDGRDDVAMGCSGIDVPGEAHGSVVVFTRNKDDTGFHAEGVLVHPDSRSQNVCGDTVVTGDFNGDGKDDLAINCSHYSLDKNSSSLIVFVRKKNGAGFDSQIASKSLILFVHKKNTRYKRLHKDGRPFCAGSMTTGDFNDDDRDDIAVICESSVEMLTRNGEGVGFKRREVIPDLNKDQASTCGSSIATGDFNKDGKADIAVGCDGLRAGFKVAAGAVITFNRSGNGFSKGKSFRHPHPKQASRCGFSLATGDFDGDDSTDIAMDCFNSNQENRTEDDLVSETVIITSTDGFSVNPAFWITLVCLLVMAGLAWLIFGRWGEKRS